MAEGKKSVLLYCDLIHTIEKMSNEIAGKFFKHYLRYINDLNPVTDELLVDITFESVKQNLKRDLLKWDEIKEKRSKAGKKSAEVRALKKNKQKPTNPTHVKSVQQNETNPTVNVNDNVTVNDNIYIYSEEHINNFKPIKENEDIKPIKDKLTEEHFLQRWSDARKKFDNMPTNIKKLTTYEKVDFNELKKDYGKTEFDQAIQGLFQQETFPKTRLRPSHFLRRENFETYLTCFTTKEVLFKKQEKYKKPIERI